MVEHTVEARGVSGSNPLVPISLLGRLWRARAKSTCRGQCADFSQREKRTEMFLARVKCLAYNAE